MTQEKNALAWNSLLYHMSQPNNFSPTELHTCQRNKRKNGEGQIRTQHLFDQIAIDDFHSVFGCVTWSSCHFVLPLSHVCNSVASRFTTPNVIIEHLSSLIITVVFIENVFGAFYFHVMSKKSLVSVKNMYIISRTRSWSTCTCK